MSSQFLDTLDDEARTALAAVAQTRSAPAVVSALFELNRYLSARELAACAEALGCPVSKSTAAVWRKRLVEGEAIDAPGLDEDAPELGAAENARRRLEEAARSGSGQEAVRWATVLARLQGLPDSAPTDEGAGLDYSRLTDAEFGQLDRLMAKVRGDAPPGAEAIPWPDPHPASEALPALAVEGKLTPAGKAVVKDVVDGVMRDRTARIERVRGRSPAPLATTKIV